MTAEFHFGSISGLYCKDACLYIQPQFTFNCGGRAEHPFSWPDVYNTACKAHFIACLPRMLTSDFDQKFRKSRFVILRGKFPCRFILSQTLPFTFICKTNSKARDCTLYLNYGRKTSDYDALDCSATTACQQQYFHVLVEITIVKNEWQTENSANQIFNPVKIRTTKPSTAALCRGNWIIALVHLTIQLNLELFQRPSGLAEWSKPLSCYS